MIEIYLVQHFNYDAWRRLALNLAEDGAALAEEW